MELIARAASLTLTDLMDILLYTPLWKLLIELVGLAAALIISSISPSPQPDRGPHGGDCADHNPWRPGAHRLKPARASPVLYPFGRKAVQNSGFVSSRSPPMRSRQ